MLTKTKKNYCAAFAKKKNGFAHHFGIFLNPCNTPSPLKIKTIFFLTSFTFTVLEKFTQEKRLESPMEID